jgi:uncharacterized BrkB/YihY/UPF0761 family membrane protein
MNKKNFFIKLTFILFIIFYFCFYSISFAAYPTLVLTLTNAFEKIRTWLLKLSTPAVAVAVSTGLFIKKFSFGDEEKIRTGRNIIRGSLFSYGFILLLDLILSTIKGLLG